MIQLCIQVMKCEVKPLTVKIWSLIEALGRSEHQAITGPTNG